MTITTTTTTTTTESISSIFYGLEGALFVICWTISSSFPLAVHISLAQGDGGSGQLFRLSGIMIHGKQIQKIA
jgi:hypothetical protein